MVTSHERIRAFEGQQPQHHKLIVAMLVALEKHKDNLKIRNWLCSKLKQTQKKIKEEKRWNLNSKKRENKCPQNRQAMGQCQKDTWKFVKPQTGKPRQM